MKIIILGAGRIGQSVASALVSERNDITVIDHDPRCLRELEERFELRGVLGNGIEPDVLAEAGAGDADMLIACAQADETNLVACKVAYQLFNVPTRIARVRSDGFKGDSPLLGKEGFAVDRIICPEESLVRYIGKLIEFPEALQVREFAGGLAQLVSVRAVSGAPLVRHTIAELNQYVPDADMRIVAIYRRLLDQPDRFIICEGQTRIEPGDEVFVLSAREHLQAVLHALHRNEGSVSRKVEQIMIAGGGRVGLRLAKQLSANGSEFKIKIIERNPERCVMLASSLPSRVLVLQGDATDEDLLAEEGIERIDLFLSLTPDDEDNIMAALLAKRMGANRVLALINRRSYADLMHGTRIDIALSPDQTILGELLAYVRQGDVQAVHSLRRGVAEALEIVARGDPKTSRVVGRRIDDITLPKEAHFGLILRGLPDAEAAAVERGLPVKARRSTDAPPQVIIPRGDTVIEPNDHVVIFIPRKRLVREVEQLFRVSATFL